jgi:uncharacterized membrane protein YkvA (DUF1232 family)
MKPYLSALYTWYRETLSHPKYRWWIILGTLAYLFSPLDLSPDLFPIVGQIDDVALVSLLVAELSQLLVDFIKGRKGANGSNVQSAEEETVEVNAVPIE